MEQTKLFFCKAEICFLFKFAKNEGEYVLVQVTYFDRPAAFIKLEILSLYEDLERVLFSIINRSVFSRSTYLAIRMFSLSIYVLFCLVIGSANGLLTSNSLLAIPVLFSACKVIDV